MPSALFLAGCVMAELPSGLLEACVVVGASSDKLRDAHQVYIYIYIYASNKKGKQIDVLKCQNVLDFCSVVKFFGFTFELAYHQALYTFSGSNPSSQCSHNLYNTHDIFCSD